MALLSIRALVEELKPGLLDLSQAIHSLRELRFEEHQSSRLLIEWLQGHDFAVQHPVAEMETAFVARFERGIGPTVAFLAEYDALPELGHACGHNLIAAISAGAGGALARWMKEANMTGQVWVIGSPGEEGGGGKVHLLEANIFSTVDAALMFHPAALDEVAPRYLAREGIDVRFYGRAAHAAGGPEHGINALDATLLFFQFLNSLRQHLYVTDKVHGIITNGGTAPNIIPEFASARILVRSVDRERLNELFERVLKAAAAAADGTGCRFEWDRFVPTYWEVRHHPVLGEWLREAFADCGRQPVLDLHPHGSTDMGNVSHVVPSIHANIGIGAGLVGHTHAFREASCSDIAGPTIVDGATMLSQVGARLLSENRLQELLPDHADG